MAEKAADIPSWAMKSKSPLRTKAKSSRRKRNGQWAAQASRSLGGRETLHLCQWQAPSPLTGWTLITCLRWFQNRPQKKKNSLPERTPVRKFPSSVLPTKRARKFGAGPDKSRPRANQWFEDKEEEQDEVKKHSTFPGTFIKEQGKRSFLSDWINLNWFSDLWWPYNVQSACSIRKHPPNGSQTFPLAKPQRCLPSMMVKSGLGFHVTLSPTMKKTRNLVWCLLRLTEKERRRLSLCFDAEDEKLFQALKCCKQLRSKQNHRCVLTIFLTCRMMIQWKAFLIGCLIM